VIGSAWRRLYRAGESFVDRLVASDPGMTRLFFALRPLVGVVAVAVLLLLVAGWPVPVVIVGGLLSLNVSTSLRDPRTSKMLIGAGGALAFAVPALVLASALLGHRVAADVVFLVVIFVAVYLRRFSGWGLPAGFAGFMSYFVAQFTRIGFGTLGLALAAACVGIAVGLTVVALMTRFVRVHAVERMLSALRVRLGKLVDGVDTALRAEGTDDRRVRRLDRASERLHEAALRIESELEEGSDLAVDERVRRSVVRAELAGERLVTASRWGLAEGLSEECRADTGTELDRLRDYLRRDPGLALRADQKRLLAGVRAIDPGTAAGREEHAEARLRRAVRELVLAVVLVRREFEPERLAESRRRAQERDEQEADALDVPDRQPEPEGARPKRFVDRMAPTTRQAVQATVAAALAITGGELLSTQRWYWAVITAFVVFVGTNSRGDLLVKGYRRALGTLLGVVVGIAVAVPLSGNVPVAAVLAVVSVFLAFYFVSVAYALTRFFITVMMSLLYDLLGAFSPGLLVLRVEETAIGAVAGALAAVLILPTKTGEAAARDVTTFLTALRTFLDRARAMLLDGEIVNLIDESREVDRSLQTLTATVTPLTHRLSPFRGRRNALSYLLTLLDMCAFRARTLAVGAETAALADHPAFSEAVSRVQLNLDRLLAALDDTDATRKRLSSGSGLAGEEDAAPADATGRRLLVYFDRLDAAILALGRPVDALRGRPASDRDSDPAPSRADPPTIPLAVHSLRE
jgi:uncharacterized membrane protein YccC